MEIELREYRQMAQRTPDKPYDNNRDLALVDQMKVKRPNTLDSTALEIGGSVPVLGAEIRSSDSD